MRIEILDDAQQDLLEGFHFYEKVTTGLGSYFLDCLFSNIDSLIIHAGIHPIVWGYHRSLSKRFPFAIYYGVRTDVVRIHAVLDCRFPGSRRTARRIAGQDTRTWVAAKRNCFDCANFYRNSLLTRSYSAEQLICLVK